MALALFGFCSVVGAIIPAEAATRLIIDTVDHGIAGKAQIVISEGQQHML